MSTQNDVRKIAMTLPGVIEGEEHFAFSVEVKGKPKGFAWVWNEKVDPKKPKQPNPEVIAIRVPNLLVKDLLMESEPEKYVVDLHYHGYPAILVRLSTVSEEELEDLLFEAWKTKASAKQIREHESLLDTGE